MPVMNQKRNHDMEAHEIMALAVPRGKARILANLLGVSESLVLKWQREPTSDENPNATGTPNPLERLDRIFDFCLLHNRSAAAIIASRYQAKLDEFYDSVLREPLAEHEWNSKIAEGMRETTQALAAIIEKAPSETVRKEWEEAQHRIEEIVRRIEAGERA